MPAPDPVGHIDRLMLKLGVHRGFPAARRRHAERFIQKGYYVEDLRRLHSHATVVNGERPGALVASWLESENGALAERITELREEARAKKRDPVLEKAMEFEPEHRREIALMQILTAVENEQWTVEGAVQTFTDRYKLPRPITVDEAREYLLNRALEDGYRSRLDGPSPRAVAALEEIRRKAKEKANAEKTE